MESLYAIGLGLGLRVLVDAVTRQNPRIDSVLIGLWEGAVMNHFLWKFPTSIDPYIAFAFRLFVDFMVTENFTRLTVVVLWTGLGMVLSEVLPEVYRDKHFRRLTRPLRRWLARPHLDFISLPSFGDGSRVRFDSAPTRPVHSGASTPVSRIPDGPPLPNLPSLSRRQVPGTYQSDAGTAVTNRTTSTLSKPAQIPPPTNQFSPIPRTRPVVSPGPSILSSSNRSTRPVASPETGVRRVVISPPPSSVASSIVSPRPPTQLPFSPPVDHDELEYAASPPPREPVISTSPPLFVPPPIAPSNNYPMPEPELRHKPSEPVLPPALEDIPEVGPEVDDPSPELGKKGYDELDAFTTPPGMAKGIYIGDDHDPLTTPPGMPMPMPKTDLSDRPPSYHYLPFGAAYENEGPPQDAQIPEMKIPETPVLVQGFEGVIVPPAARDPMAANDKASGEEDLVKDSASVRAGPPVRGQSVWGGSVKADQSVKGAPSIKGGQSVWEGSQKDIASVRGDVPVKSMKGGSIWGSLWGGSSVRDDASEEVGRASVKGDRSVLVDRSARGDASIRGSVRGDRSIRGAPTVLSDLVENPSVGGNQSARGGPPVQKTSSIRRDTSIRAPSSRGNPSVRGAPSTKGSVRDIAKGVASNKPEGDRRSTISLSNVNPLGQTRSEIPEQQNGLIDQERRETEEMDDDGLQLLKEPTKTTTPANITSLPHIQSVEGMKIEEALLATENAYKTALDAGAPQLNIICGSGKNLRKRLVRMLEDQYGVSLPPSSNTGELVVPLPNIPPATVNVLDARLVP